MPLKQSEAIVLRTYPLREADLLVTLFTRSEGKVKGVAKSAKRSQKRFGGALEPATCVRAFWQDREGSELARLDSCDVLLSPLSGPIDYARCVALAHVAEMLDELLPDREPNDSIFRLAWAILQNLETSAIWMPITYFDLWMLRLMGFLPPLDECIDAATCSSPSPPSSTPCATASPASTTAALPARRCPSNPASSPPACSATPSITSPTSLCPHPASPTSANSSCRSSTATSTANSKPPPSSNASTNTAQVAHSSPLLA